MEFVFHLIRSLSCASDYRLIAQFDDGTVKEYCVKRLFSKHEAFKEFEKKPQLFSKAKIDAGGFGVVWNENLDLSANEIWANGKTLTNSFNGLMSFSDASRIWQLNESTLRKALAYGKLKAGTDCCKYGKQWVITTDAMIREYGPYPKSNTEESDFSWDNLMAAEEEPAYVCNKRGHNQSDSYDHKKDNK